MRNNDVTKSDELADQAKHLLNHGCDAYFLHYMSFLLQKIPLAIIYHCTQNPRLHLFRRMHNLPMLKIK